MFFEKGLLSSKILMTRRNIKKKFFDEKITVLLSLYKNLFLIF